MKKYSLTLIIIILLFAEFVQAQEQTLNKTYVQETFELYGKIAGLVEENTRLKEELMIEKLNLVKSDTNAQMFQILNDKCQTTCSEQLKTKNETIQILKDYRGDKYTPGG